MRLAGFELCILPGMSPTMLLPLSYGRIYFQSYLLNTPLSANMFVLFGAASNNRSLRVARVAQLCLLSVATPAAPILKSSNPKTLEAQ